MDVNKEIRRAVDTGKVVFGTRQTQKILSKKEGEIVIVSTNLPIEEREKIKHITKVMGKKFYEHNITGLNLGSVCGKPFVISALTVLDKGKSNILDVHSD